MQKIPIQLLKNWGWSENLFKEHKTIHNRSSSSWTLTIDAKKETN